jgi:hypothetical protein
MVTIPRLYPASRPTSASVSIDEPPCAMSLAVASSTRRSAAARRCGCVSRVGVSRERTACPSARSLALESIAVKDGWVLVVAPAPSWHRTRPPSS